MEVLEAFEPCVDEVVCSNRVEVVNIGPKRVEELGGVGGRYWGDLAPFTGNFQDVFIVK